MEEANISELTAQERFICNLIYGLVIVLLGVFLLLTGINIIPLSLGDIALPSCLFSLGVVFFATAFVQNNSVSLWLSFFFIIPAVVVTLVTYVDSLTYAKMYPFFILIPAISSLFTLILTSERKIHFNSIGFFGVISLILALQSFGVLGWQVVIPGLIIMLGAIILIFAVRSKKT